MADTFTTNLNLTKPEPGAAEDTWGISLNSDLDTLDAIFSSSGTQINLNPNQVNFADNKKAIFGTGSDLEIYHSGNDSFIRDAGTGDLYIRSSSALRLQALSGENYAVFTENGAATFYYDNGTKLATTSTGIDVSGTVVADGLTVDTSTLVVDSTNNRVGVGTTSPSSALETVGGDGITISNSGDTFLQLKTTGTTATNYIEFKDSGGSSGNILYNHTDNFLAAKVNGAERLRINSSGNLEFNAFTTHTSLGNVSISIPDRQASIYNVGDRGNITIQASSATSGVQAMSGGRVLLNAGNSNNGQSGDIILSTGVNLLNSADKGAVRFNIGGRTSSEEVARITGDGITFNGDTAAANALDDYEEGTFTPLFYGGSSGTAENSSSGYYTKIGRLVTLHVDVYNKTFGTYSGDLRMQLPFTNVGTNIPSSGGDVYFYPNSAWDGVSNFVGFTPRCYNTSYLNFSLITLDSDRQTQITSSNTSSSGASGIFLRFSFTYVTNL